jgi:hypothetical protein
MPVVLAAADARTSTTEDIAVTTRREFLQIGAGVGAGQMRLLGIRA